MAAGSASTSKELSIDIVTECKQPEDPITAVWADGDVHDIPSRTVREHLMMRTVENKVRGSFWQSDDFRIMRKKDSNPMLLLYKKERQVGFGAHQLV